MSQQTQVQATTEVGRFVAGSLYELQTHDYITKERLLIKTGPNKGQPTQRCSFGIAFPKRGLQHWRQLSYTRPDNSVCYWADECYKMGVASFSQDIANRKDFAWKVVDGDSTELNKNNVRPCDNEGYPGHWVFWFSSSFAPDVCNADGSAYILEKDAIKPGDFVQVCFTTQGNGQAQNPGIYLNGNVVSKQWDGPRIQLGAKVDPKQAGFGGLARPAGALDAPQGGMSSPPAGGAPPPPPGAAAAAGAAPPPPGAAAAAPPAPNAVAPHPGILNAGAAAPPPPGAAAAPPPPPAAPTRTMTAKANGAPYEAFSSKGWKDADLIAQGYMVVG